MDITRLAIRSILLEQKMDQAFIMGKAQDQNLYPKSVDQEGLTIKIQLSSQGDADAIRRFKNQLRIRNPRLQRIEVRQPQKVPPKEKKRPQQLHYTDWRKKVLQQLKRAGSEFGWKFYTDPQAGKNTEFFLFVRGTGAGRELVRIRVSEHPSGRERPDIDVDMSGAKGSVSDVRARLKRRVATKDRYPLI